MSSLLTKEEIKKHSIGFYKWMDKTYIRYSSKKRKGYGTWRDGVPKVFYTISELYELYQQSK